MKRTTISMDEGTKKQLTSLGKKGESYEDILQRLLDNASRLCQTDEKEPENQVDNN